MNMITIAWKEIKTEFRDRQALFFMLAFPIVLMLVLGSALSNTFTTGLPIDDIKVLYTDTTDAVSFKPFLQVAEEAGIHLEKADAGTDAKQLVEENKYDGYMEVTDGGIRLYVNNRNNIEASILNGMFSSLVDRYNVTYEIKKVAPEKLATALQGGQENYVSEFSVDPERKPGSMDYYAVVITTMIILVRAMFASTLITGERVRKTGDRLLVTPTRKSEIFIGKVVGSLVSNSLAIILIIMMSKWLFDANWGDHIGLVFLVLLTEIVFAISLGITFGFLPESNAAPRVIIMVFIQLAAFFGGSYFKIENPTGILKFVTDLSPLTWMNQGLIKLIYTNDFSAAVPAVSINLTLSLVFLLVSMVILQRKEGL